MIKFRVVLFRIYELLMNAAGIASTKILSLNCGGTICQIAFEHKS